jgi:hypothetical protein
MKIECGCHCIKCGKTDLESNQVGKTEEDGLILVKSVNLMLVKNCFFYKIMCSIFCRIFGNLFV